MKRLSQDFSSLALLVAVLAGSRAVAQTRIWRAGEHPKIAGGQGGFTGTLLNDDEFGSGVAVLGDVDGDGIGDLAVGAWQHASQDRGGVWVLLMHADSTVRVQREIGSGLGGFTGTLDPDDRFGTSVAGLGDLDGDGIPDLAVGAQNDDDGGTDRGAVWILFLQADGTVRTQQKISAASGLLLSDADRFGAAVACPGDLDADGIPDLAVGAPFDDAGGVDRGALWLVLLNADGTMKAKRRISAVSGGFGGALADGDAFGSAVCALGDFDGDGFLDIAAGARGGAGAVWLLFLAADGSVHAERKIASTLSGYESAGLFGSAVAAPGDLDGDGIEDLAVGAPGTDASGSAGIMALLFLEDDGNVRQSVEIGGAVPCAWNGAIGLARFGGALARAGDLDGDGISELLVGAPGDDSAGPDRGAVYTVFLESERILPRIDARKISSRSGGFGGALADGDFFGWSGSAIGDLDGDGNVDLAVGAPTRGGADPGSLWILLSDSHRGVRAEKEIGAGAGGFTGVLDPFDRFGSAVVGLGDVDGDGVEDVAVGAPGKSDFDPGAPSEGAVWVLFLKADGTVKSQRKIGDGQGGLPAGLLQDYDLFGSSLAALGDLDGNGVVDLAVGAPGDDDYDIFPQNCFHFCCDTVGSVWILFLQSDGSVSGAHEISASSGDLPFHLDVEDMFGSSVAALGDLDGDGLGDLAVGGPFTDCQDFGPFGAAYVLFLVADGTVRDARRLTEGESGVTGLREYEYFGLSLAALGDVDGDGTSELAAGTVDDVGACFDGGALRMLHLRPDGTVARMEKIGAARGGFAAELEVGDGFIPLGALPDVDGDGGELLVGSPGDDDGGRDRGAVWWLDLGGLGHERPRR